MTPERWQKIKDICSAAVDSEPDARRALLQELCAGDDELRRSVEAMIADACSEETAQTSSPRRDAAVQFAAAAVDGRDWKPGVIGRYRILRLLGEGGMGAVYEAEQDSPRRTVALKIIKPGLPVPNCCADSSRSRRRSAVCSIPASRRSTRRAPQTPASAPQPYFAMEFIRGAALSDYADSAALICARAARADGARSARRCTTRTSAASSIAT